jgi:hypothetical protein
VLDTGNAPELVPDSALVDATATAVWVDEDDTQVQLDIKSRDIGSSVVNGVEYEQQLRHQYVFFISHLYYLI